MVNDSRMIHDPEGDPYPHDILGILGGEGSNVPPLYYLLVRFVY